MSAKQWNVSPFLKQCIITAGIAVNNLAFGSAVGYSAILLPQLRGSSIKLTREQESWIASINLMTFFIGNLLTMTSMRRGRSFTNYVICSLHAVSWLIVSLANSYEVLLIGRFLNGTAHGLYVTVFGVMLGEYISPLYRGNFFAVVSLAQGVGVLFVHLIGSFLHWQHTALLLSCCPIISFAIAVLTPESPSWYAVEGKYEECKKAFKWIRGNGEDEELDKMIKTRVGFTKNTQTWRVYCKREQSIPMVIYIAVYVVLSSSGSLVLASYMNEVLSVLIGPHCNMAGWMFLLNGVRLVGNSITICVIEKIPRRTLLLSSGVVCIVMFFAEAAYVYSKSIGLLDVFWLPALLIVIHVATIGFGVVALTYVIMGEIFPLEYRASCSFLCSIPLCFFAFVLIKSFPGLVMEVGLGGTWLVGDAGAGGDMVSAAGDEGSDAAGY